MYNTGMQETFHHELMPTKHYYMTEDVKEEKPIEPEKLNEEEKVQVFKQELKKMGITDTWKWEDANRVLQDSKYYSILPTLKQKKQAFVQYITQFKDKIDQNKRESRRRQIDEYFEMLDQVQDINILSKFQD
jgi:hypothetical protein